MTDANRSAQSDTSSEKRRVLVLCTGNSARSQIAEGLLRHLGGDAFEVASAGTEPKSELHPLAVKAMAELGIDISTHRPKDVRQFLDQQFDYVLTVCDRARESCPVFPGARRQLHWSLEDPAAARGPRQMEVFRRVRDELQQRLRRFVAAVSGTLEW